MGISPGGGDIYSAQRERQWVDITGLAPGPATMRAQANPLLCILESDAANNATSDARQIPGVRAAAVGASTGAAAPVGLALAGTVVAPDVPARRSGGCTPGASRSCYVWASAAGPLSFRVVEEPSHGTVALAPARRAAGGGHLHAGRGLRGGGPLHLRGHRRARADVEPGDRDGDGGGGPGRGATARLSIRRRRRARG